MKGPRSRWKHDVRRVWECPACGKRVYSGGQVTHRVCSCALDHTTSMRLVEERKIPLPSPGLASNVIPDAAPPAAG
ncbi:MAG: hypothetical protein L0Y72_07740 [Gemmataceae bacterium]|nr:hypothetical protein [Gemmataceae bacterium]MCI0738921.1 hypothetical protein [Gemmataceae bacterium]